MKGPPQGPRLHIDIPRVQLLIEDKEGIKQIGELSLWLGKMLGTSAVNSPGHLAGFPMELGGTLSVLPLRAREGLAQLFGAGSTGVLDDASPSRCDCILETGGSILHRTLARRGA